MDQVRAALAWIKRYHFWLLIAIVALVGAGSWYMASSALAADFDKNRRIIESEQSASSQLGRKPYHPNETINKRQQEENRRLAQKVRELWTRLHGRQREEVLKWPTQLGDDFVGLVERQQFGERIPVGLRQRYQNYIERFYPELPKIVNAPESNGRRSGGGRPSFSGVAPPEGPGRGDEPEEEHLVTWDDQEYIREQLNLETTPSTLRIWVTQEDLWVYTTLLRAIAAVNDAAGSDRYSNAAVRDIDVLEVGKPAAKPVSTAGRIERPESDSADNLDGLDDGGELDDSASDFGDGEQSEEVLLLSGRYLDGEGNRMPVTEGDYRYGTEFKRLPVRLELRMDQRWLPQLISELSNAPLLVEVTEVRINPESDGGGRRSSRPRNPSSRSDSENVFDSEPNVVPVAMRGIVYIYNPVDEEVLAVGDEGV